MLNRIELSILTFLVAASGLQPMTAMAQSAIYNARVVEVNTGWNDDTVGVTLDQPTINPANCPVHDGIYISPAAAPGNRTFLAAALTALANKLPVTVVVSNTQCGNNRPLLWSVSPYSP